MTLVRKPERPPTPMRTVDAGGTQYVVELGPARPGQWRDRSFYVDGVWVLIKWMHPDDPGPSVAGLYGFKVEDHSEYLDPRSSCVWQPNGPARTCWGVEFIDYEEWRH